VRLTVKHEIVDRLLADLAAARQPEAEKWTARRSRRYANGRNAAQTRRSVRPGRTDQRGAMRIAPSMRALSP
jgi:hypothetical protein